MPDSKHMYLPKVQGGINEPEVAGVWHGYQRGVLRSLSAGIVVGQAAVERGVSSVPDAWARPLMFQNALRPDSGHPMRARMVQEWRGLLSLLALHKFHGYNVDIAALALGDAAIADGPGREFVRALRRLLPAPVALEQGKEPYDWGDTLMVRYEGIPVGAFSPTTLVYTAADYQHRLRAHDTLSLKDGDGFLAPPTAEQGDELLYVAEWVEQLRRRLNAPASAAGSAQAAVLDAATKDPTAGDAVRTINGLLDEWIRELRATFKVRDGELIDAKDVEVDPDMVEVRPPAAFLPRYRVYQELLRPLRRAPGSNRIDSDLLLRHRRNRSPHAHVVVITPALLGTGGKIWGSRRLIHLGGDAVRAVDQYFGNPDGWGERVDREELAPANAIWIRPERYFLTPTLTETADGTRLLAEGWQSLNGEPHLLLPFSPRILDFFTPAEVREVLRPEYKKVDNGIQFSFLLPVSGRLERVQKTYRYRNEGPGEGSIVKLAVPPVQLFPRYIDASWRRYYLFQGGADRVTVHPILADERPGEAGKRRITERTHTAGEGGMTARAVEIAGDRAFPEALTFAPAGQRDQSLGIALVPPPAEPEGLATKWRIGIDFGTSNTNVFRQSETTSTAEPWQFDFARYVWNVTDGDAAARDAELRDFFVPPESVDLPVATALRVFQQARKDTLLLDYFIYFPVRYELPNNVYSDIKWDSEERQQTKYFLESLLFLLLIETGLRRVKQSTLVCSYPKAFSDDRLVRYRGEWEEVVGNLLDGEYRVLNRLKGGETDRVDVPRIIDPIFEAEGVAAGEFFASEKTNGNDADRDKIRIAGVCLDVGGGTTDVSIWYDNDIVFDASIMLAGRQISRLMQQNPRVVDALFSNAAAHALEQKRNEPVEFAARLNVILRREEATVRQRLIENANDPEVRWMRRILAVEFGAIAFYTASLLRAVDVELQGALAAELEPGGLFLYWGGNAAKLINWVDFGRYDANGIASKMLNAILFNTLRELEIKLPPTQLAQKQSPGHKREAAGGLVVMQLGRTRKSRHAQEESDIVMASESDDVFAAGVVCGENIELSDRKVGHLDVITNRALFEHDRTRFRRTSLDRLKRFLEIVNHFGVRFGLFTDDTKITLDQRREVQIADAVRARFIEAQSKREGERVLEPVFILEVKILLELLRNELR